MSELNETDLRNILAFIDLGCKTKGLEVATVAAIIADKINRMLNQSSRDVLINEYLDQPIPGD